MSLGILRFFDLNKVGEQIVEGRLSGTLPVDLVFRRYKSGRIKVEVRPLPILSEKGVEIVFQSAGQIIASPAGVHYEMPPGYSYGEQIRPIPRWKDLATLARIQEVIDNPPPWQLARKESKWNHYTCGIYHRIVSEPGGLEMVGIEVFYCLGFEAADGLATRLAFNVIAWLTTKGSEPGSTEYSFGGFC